MGKPERVRGEDVQPPGKHAEAETEQDNEGFLHARPFAFPEEGFARAAGAEAARPYRMRAVLTGEQGYGSVACRGEEAAGASGGKQGEHQHHGH